MSIEIFRGTNDKPASSGELAQILSGQTDLFGYLLIGYLIISTPEGRRIIHALLVCSDRGIILFDLIECREVFTDDGIVLDGVVEVDEVYIYIGGKESNKHTSKKLNAGRGALGKTAINGSGITMIRGMVAGMTGKCLIYRELSK